MNQISISEIVSPPNILLFLRLHLISEKIRTTVNDRRRKAVKQMIGLEEISGIDSVADQIVRKTNVTNLARLVPCNRYVKPKSNQGPSGASR